MRSTPSIRTVSSSSRRDESSSDESWQSRSSHSTNQGFKGDTGSGPYFDAGEIPPDHFKPFGTRNGEDPYETLEEASRVSIRSVSASEIKTPSDSSWRRRQERKLFIQRYQPNGTMMGRERGYKRPVENTCQKNGLFFGNRPGLIDVNSPTASFKENETTANSDQSSSLTNATPAKPMYSGNVAHHPSTATPGSPIAVRSRYLPVPSPPPLGYWEEPKPFCEIPQSSHCGTQAESTKPSWYESSTTFLGKAARSCYTASKSKYDWAAGWYKKGLALTGFRQTAMDSCFGSYIREMTRTKRATLCIGATARDHCEKLRHQPWIQRTNSMTNGPLWWSRGY